MSTGLQPFAGFQLATAREDAVAFTVANELVVMGGRDPAGQYVTTAERFDLTDNLRPLGVTAAYPRARGTAHLIDGDRVIVVGGVSPNNIPVSVVESYQPSYHPPALNTCGPYF